MGKTISQMNAETAARAILTEGHRLDEHGPEFLRALLSNMYKGIYDGNYSKRNSILARG